MQRLHRSGNPFSTPLRRMIPLLAMLCLTPVRAQAPPRFRAHPLHTTHAAEWIAGQGRVGAFGAGARVTLFERDDSLRELASIVTPVPVAGGLLVGTDLFLVERRRGGDRLVRLDTRAPQAGAEDVGLAPVPRGALRMAQMDDYLIVAEDHRGLRILSLPHPHANGHGDRHVHAGLVPVGTLDIDDAIRAVTASLRTIYVATDSAIWLVDARTPAAPHVLRRVPTAGDVRAMAANGPTLTTLGADGLRRIDFDTAGQPLGVELHPDLRGTSLQLDGRTMLVTTLDGDVRAVQDTSAVAATIFIQVGDVFFNPPGLVNVNQGDTVTWQKPGTVASHNVFSCTALQSGCSGITATESFTSGAPTAAGFNFSHTFTTVGDNPYVCQIHFTTMQGNIRVAAATAAPPGVADGRNGTTPMVVDKLSADGADLRVIYDAGACAPDAANHDLLFGSPGQLPAALGGIYTPGGSVCNLGTTSPYAWIGSPVVASGDFVWWLLVADDGVGREGSWSLDVAGNERRGPGTNGASNLCGNADKDVSNACPP